MKDLKKINELETQGNWSNAIEELEGNMKTGSQEVELYIRLIFLLWYSWLESGAYKVEIKLSSDVLAAKLLHYFQISRNIYSNNPDYLFFIGYMILITDWLFEDAEFSSPEAYAIKMIETAYNTQPDNLLYKWGYFMAVKQDKQKTREVATEIGAKIIINEFHLLDQSLMGEYFKEMIIASSKSDVSAL